MMGTGPGGLSIWCLDGIRAARGVIGGAGIANLQPTGVWWGWRMVRRAGGGTVLCGMESNRNGGMLYE